MTEEDPHLLSRVVALLQRSDEPIDAAAEAEALLQHAHRAGDPDSALALAERRAEGVPLPLLLGRETFMGLSLHCAPGVLAPRKETELLGATALRLLRNRPDPHSPARMIDMCCGSGNLACGIANEMPGLQVWASDLTDECVALARRNASETGLGDRVQVVQGDLFAPLASLGLEGAVDAVVCNPPYISTGRLEGDRAELLSHEPREAFDGGPYGLTIHQRVIREALPFLSPGGWLLFEFGVGQSRQIALLFQRARAYETPGFYNDENGEPRVAAARKAQP